MTILHCYVDNRTLVILKKYATRSGRTVEDLAEAAIAETALRALPPPSHGNDYASHHEKQAVIWDMKADNMPPGDPSIPGCRAEADRERAIAQHYRSEV